MWADDILIEVARVERHARQGAERRLAERRVTEQTGDNMTDQTEFTCAKLTSVENIIQFMQAGNATFTLKSLRTGDRFTYKVAESDDGKCFFVRVLTGPNNESDYQYLGVIRNGVYAHGRRSRIGSEASSAKAFTWFHQQMVDGKLHPQLEVWHEGHCGRCNLPLTVPELIACGFGPICAKKMGIVLSTQGDLLEEMMT